MTIAYCLEILFMVLFLTLIKKYVLKIGYIHPIHHLMFQVQKEKGDLRKPALIQLPSESTQRLIIPLLICACFPTVLHFLFGRLLIICKLPHKVAFYV